MLRNIIQINTEKCTGCGACLVQCAENALAIVDGKATLVRDVYCDGLGACLGSCPEDALTIIQREADPFDATQIPAAPHTPTPISTAPQGSRQCSCPSSTPRILAPLGGQTQAHNTDAACTCNARLSTWPIQLTLIPANAPFLSGAHLLLAADCTGFAMANMGGLLADKALLIACPKLDNAAAHTQKLAEIFRTAQPKAITILRMSVPCCGELVRITETALREVGMNIPLHIEVVNVG